MTPPTIGVDFDNTLISYDSLFYRLALERGLIPAELPQNKTRIRDHIRTLPGGEAKWITLQALAYGPRIGEATLMEGVESFFHQCRERAIPVVIVSHKTERAASEDMDVRLREPALQWMKNKGFFAASGLGLSARDIYFEATLRAKVKRVGTLGCAAFVDDMEKTLRHPAFPAGLAKILFSPHHVPAAQSDVRWFSSWPEIARYLLNEFLAEP